MQNTISEGAAYAYCGPRLRSRPAQADALASHLSYISKAERASLSCLCDYSRSELFDTMLLLATCVILFVALSLYLFYPSSTLNRQLLTISAEHGCELPNHVPRPYFSIPAGLAFLKALKENRGLRYIQSEFKQHGHTFTQFQLGQRYIWSDEPENIKEVLSVQFPNFNLGTIRKDAASPLVGNGIFLSEGARWSHLRAVIRPSFNRAQVADLTMFEAHLQDLFALIPADSTTVDLQDLFNFLTLDITTDYLFGYSINTLRPDSDRTYKEFNLAFNHGLGRIWPRSRMNFFMDVIPDPEFRKSCKLVHKIVDKLVEQSLSARSLPDAEKAPSRYVYLHEMADSTNDPKELRDHALSILMAAKDSTAAALSSIFYLLARHPAVWTKLSTEIGDLNGKIPTFDELKKLKYLYNVINEGRSSSLLLRWSYSANANSKPGLRLFPPVPVNVRKATTNTYLPRGGGPSGRSPMLVEKGNLFLYSVFSMHRRKDLWGQDADEFKPERWEGRQPGPEFLPFNSGPRICVGRKSIPATFIYLSGRDQR